MGKVGRIGRTRPLLIEPIDRLANDAAGDMDAKAQLPIDLGSVDPGELPEIRDDAVVKDFRGVWRYLPPNPYALPFPVSCAWPQRGSPITPAASRHVPAIAQGVEKTPSPYYFSEAGTWVGVRSSSEPCGRCGSKVPLPSIQVGGFKRLMDDPLRFEASAIDMTRLQM